MVKVKKWTIIRTSGNAEVLSGPKGLEGRLYGYVAVLNHLYTDMQSGGSNYDRPNMLLADGIVVIEKGLNDIAYSYGHDLRAAVDKATNEVNEKYKNVEVYLNGQG